MANPPRGRKRVRAIPRAPDGSAFQKCSDCGVLVPITLEDMHECRVNRDVKRFWGKCERPFVRNLRVEEQPRSAFRLFMEKLERLCEDKEMIEVDREGFETWRNMGKEEKECYELEARKADMAYLKKWLDEIKEMSQDPVDDEADSALVGKFDQFVDYKDSGSSFLDSDSDIMRSYSTIT